MKRKVSFLISFILIISFVISPLTAYAGFAPGYCGESAQWKYDASGVLTIYGTGEVYDFGDLEYGSYWGAPWDDDAGEITSAVIESGITALGQEMFRNCSNLVSVSLPDTLVSENEALVSCSGLKTIEVSGDNEVYSAVDGVLFSKDKTELILYPAGKTEQSYSVPEGVTSIADRAICSDCLTDLKLPEGLVSIGDNAFSGCPSLEEISIPSTVSDLGGLAFAGLDKLRSINVDSRSKTFYSDEGVLINGEKGSLVCYPPARGAYSYAVPDGVSSLEAYSFTNAGKLHSIYLPAITEIDYPCFTGCSDLWNIYYAGSWDDWDNVWYVPSGDEDPIDTYYVSILHDIEREDFDSKYSGVQGPKSGTCGDGITWSLDEGGTLTVSGSGPMADYSYDDLPPWNSVCGLIKKVILSEGVTRLGVYAFCGCTMIEDVVFPSSLKSIGESSLMLTGVSSVTIPSGVEEIENYAFTKSHDLESINVDPSNPYFRSEDGILFNADKTAILLYPCAKGGRSYCIPSGVTTVGSDAFFMCEELQRITVPEGVTVLEDSCISSCEALRSLYLPLSLKTISNYAVSYNDLLTDVYYSGVSEQWDNIAVDYSKNASLKGAAMHYVDGNLSGASETVEDTGAWDASYGSGTWVMDGSGTLTISGTGSMVTYVRMIAGSTYFVTSPWWEYRHKITRIVVEEGITYIATNAFSDCTNLTDVVLPESLKGIDKDAFYGCSSLTDLWYVGTSSQWSVFVTIRTEEDMYGRQVAADQYIWKATRHYEFTPAQLVRQGFATPVQAGKTVSTYVTAAYAGEVYFIAYDADGRFLSASIEAVEPGDNMPLSFTAENENATEYRLLLVTDESWSPACFPAEGNF
ncbi:MAG: leucine-rich repeat protein [Oscillospiraceae bacterium]|nr:leucine-rich repeat protein [Oscillospiraceae bacterium]